LSSKKVKTYRNKQIKGYKSASDSNEFAKVVVSHSRLYESIHKKCIEIRRKKKKNIYIGLKLDILLAIKNDGRKVWK